METTFVIIDDDMAVCKILEQAIKKITLEKYYPF